MEDTLAKLFQEEAERDQNVWHLATPLQLLRLEKLLGVGSKVLAERLGVKPPLISMWLHERQPMPLRYGPLLLPWVQRDEEAARQRWQKEIQALPTEALKTATIQARHDPLILWRLQVLHEAGTIERSIRRHLLWLGTIGSKAVFTESDYRTMETLTEVLRNNLALRKDRAEPQEPAQGERDEP